MTMKMPLQVAEKYLVQERFLFHCNIRVKVPQRYGASLLDECFNLLEKIDLDYNSYKKDSWFDRINQNAGQWTPVDNATLYLVRKSLQISALTDGAYDMTVMPLIRLWGFYKEQNWTKPTQQDIDTMLQRVGYQYVELDPMRVKIRQGQELITASFMKAFAVDEVIKMLRERGVTNAIVNAGGSTIYALTDESHPSWQINIPDPLNRQAYTKQISLSNACFSMSAMGTNYVEIEGQKYSHILNALTGIPSTNLQTGVVSENAVTADLLSTAFFCLQSSDFIRYAERMKSAFSFGAYLIDANNQFQFYDFNPLPRTL